MQVAEVELTTGEERERQMNLNTFMKELLNSFVFFRKGVV